MRKIRIMEHISLGSVMQLSADENDFPHGDWTAPHRTPAGRELILAAYGESFGLLLGRRTYDMWSGLWPKAPSSPMADRLNAATKYIATHRPEGLAWGPAETLGSDIVEGIRRIKAQDGPDVILSGSSTLTSTLLEHGLADEVLLVTFRSCWARGSASLRREPRHAHSSSSARKLWRRASSSALTSRTDLCAPVPWAHRRKPTSEITGKRTGLK
jgi:dihydrofolate reductase